MTLRDFLDRYGVMLAIIGLVTVVVAALPSNAPNQVASQLGALEDTGTSAAGSTGGRSAASGPSDLSADGSSAAGGGTGVRGDAIGAATGPGGGGKPSVVFGKGDCRPDGRENAISRYSPPCALWTGSNGGATARGVFADKVIAVRWVGQVDPATQAILQANKLADSEDTRRKAIEALRRYANQHTITYGREVRVVTLPAGGQVDDDRAMKADAVRIADDIKAFAVFDGTPDSPIPKVLAQELARRGVVCICTVSLSKDFYLENPPYIFGAGLPTSTEYAAQIAEFIGKRMKGRKAQWAGDEFNPAQQYRDKVRKFGLLYLTGVNDRYEPEGKRYADTQISELARYGIKLCKECVQGYYYDPGRNQNDMSTIIAKFKGAGVTTIIPFVDPLSPILITQEASNQNWFPEWFITGSGLSDTTAAGRLYDSRQWRHAFGISPLAVPWEHVERSGAYRAAHHGDPSLEDGEEGVLITIYAAEIAPVFLGIHMAGPILTPDTFARGMFAYPQTGGSAAAPTIFYTREAPTAIKDFIEVWFDVDRSGPDEREEQGVGMMVKANGAQRYRPGQWPTTNPSAFVENGKELTATDNPPGPPEPEHEQDGHTHTGPCKSCPGFQTKK